MTKNIFIGELPDNEIADLLESHEHQQEIDTIFETEHDLFFRIIAAMSEGPISYNDALILTILYSFAVEDRVREEHGAAQSIIEDAPNHKLSL